MSAELHPKAVREGYSPSPFFYEQTNERSEARLVGWTGSVAQLQSLFERLTSELPNNVDILLKVRRDEPITPDSGDPWERYYGPAITVYSAEARFRRAFEENGFEERVEALVSDEPRWNYSPKEAADQRRSLIRLLQLQRV